MRRPASSTLCSRRGYVRVAVALWALVAAVVLWAAVIRPDSSGDAALEALQRMRPEGRPSFSAELGLKSEPQSISSTQNFGRVPNQSLCSLAEPQERPSSVGIRNENEAAIASYWWWQHYLHMRNESWTPSYGNDLLTLFAHKGKAMKDNDGGGTFRFVLIKELSNRPCAPSHRIVVAADFDSCKEKSKRSDSMRFTTDLKVDALVRSTFGPDYFEATVVSPGRSVTPVILAFDSARCVYYSQRFHASQGSVFLVDHLHTDWNAWRETTEEAHFDYVMQRVAPLPPPASAVACGHDEARGNQAMCVEELTVPDRDAAAWSFGASQAVDSPVCTDRSPSVAGDGYGGGGYVHGGWVSHGKDPNPLYHQSPLKGYWLTYKGMQWKAYSKVPQYELDILGRMNFGEKYSWARGHHHLNGAVEGNICHVAAPCRTRECILELLRDKTIYFFGDSHMRIFFYGFLSRLQILYPLDKVWRDDRTDVIKSHNVTVKFVASYFLNFSRPSAAGMMTDRTAPIVVAGVGQHHSCHCWSLEKHMSVVRSSLCDLVSAGRDSSPLCKEEATSLQGASDHAAWRHTRHVVWFGIPAQPYNSHLYRRKPVGQSRKDCRNNARHLLYSAFQRAAVEGMRRRLADSSSSSTLHFLDSFMMSLGMQHTSLDGAHYYTWAREAWIDALVDIIRNQRR